MVFTVGSGFATQELTSKILLAEPKVEHQMFTDNEFQHDPMDGLYPESIIAGMQFGLSLVAAGFGALYYVTAVHIGLQYLEEQEVSSSHLYAATVVTSFLLYKAYQPFMPIIKRIELGF